MNWLENLFSEEPITNLEKKASSKERIEFRNSTIKKIKRAKITSENDVLKLSFLVGSYLGNLMQEATGVWKDMFKTLIYSLDQEVIFPLENKKKLLQKNSGEWAVFHNENSPDIPRYLKQLNSLINGSKDVQLQEAIVRPIVRYNFKVLNQNLLGKDNQTKLKSEYNITGRYNDNAGINQVVKKEIAIAYIPRFIGYTSLTIGSIILIMQFMRKKK